MRIGQVADAAGVSVDTIRFYERRGVLPEPRRRPSGYRVYGADTVERIRLARTLQANGFTLDEVIDAVHAFEAGTTCADERWRLERSVDRIDRRIAELRAVRRTVLATMAACDDGTCQLVRPTR
ncbi:MerR family transcriptional regulator [Nitriliruptor alkaliphilus]|uniref:MerR family transcriptional regulator n=1 Tax=Nitriliruptor alkaliphilus TaxID=427918 RepID=UPI000697E77F|nr:MerR family transcriptional regulator [Nitriliruptor alkaliphilus]